MCLDTHTYVHTLEGVIEIYVNLVIIFGFAACVYSFMLKFNESKMVGVY